MPSERGQHSPTAAQSCDHDRLGLKCSTTPSNSACFVGNRSPTRFGLVLSVIMRSPNAEPDIHGYASLSAVPAIPPAMLWALKCPRATCSMKKFALHAGLGQLLVGQVNDLRSLASARQSPTSGHRKRAQGGAITHAELSINVVKMRLYRPLRYIKVHT